RGLTNAVKLQGDRGIVIPLLSDGGICLIGTRLGGIGIVTGAILPDVNVAGSRAGLVGIAGVQGAFLANIGGRIAIMKLQDLCIIHVTILIGFCFLGLRRARIIAMIMAVAMVMTMVASSGKCSTAEGQCTSGGDSAKFDFHDESPG